MAYDGGNPFVNTNDYNCSTTSSVQTVAPGNSGRTYLTHPDGNAVFVTWGRSMHVNENENFVEVYGYPTQNLDWFSVPQIQVTVTLTPRDGGSPTVATASSDYSLRGYTTPTF